MITFDIAASFNEARAKIEEFMLAQDVATAATRFERLLTEIFNFIDLVKLHPQIGRPFKPVRAKSPDEVAQLDRIRHKIADSGLDDPREYILRDYVLLYVRSDSRVSLISIRHQREVTYRFGPE
jgi:hypothetical protein